MEPAFDAVGAELTLVGGKRLGGALKFSAAGLPAHEMATALALLAAVGVDSLVPRRKETR
jgi:hypothetical protein